MTALSKLEATRLGTCEAAIEKGLAVFVEVGRALTEIRDGKLYRETHKTFEAYCQQRWEIGRSRAYELIDQAKVTDDLLAGGVDLSAMADISKRAVRVLKSEPEAVEAVKVRVRSGEEPAQAIKVVVTKIVDDKADRQTKHDQHRQETVDQLPANVRQLHTAAQDRRRQPAAQIGISADDLQELNDTIAAQNEEIGELRTRVARFDDMIVAYERGGFELVVTSLEERIEVLKRQVERESQEKVKNLRSAEYWKQKALEVGANDDIIIDMATGEMTRG